MRKLLSFTFAFFLVLTALGGCGESPAGTAGSNITLISCANHSGEPTEYYVPRPGEALPTNVGAKFEFVKISGNDHCYSADQFQNATDPDKCPKVHFHGNKTATDGCVLVDNDFETCCGVATIDQVTHYVGYEYEGDDPSDTPPPTMYGEELEDDTPYCGPDITEKLLEAFKRVQSRVNDLPDSEKGPVDGTMFLNNNGMGIDFRVSKKRDENDNPVCPSEECMAPDGQGTVMICGQCVMEHIANDMMFGVVANMVEVPFSVQLIGAHYAEYTSYGGLDPMSSQAAYAMGNNVAEAMGPGGDLSIGDFCDTLNNTEHETSAVTGINAFELMGEEQDFLIDCVRPPDDCKPEIMKDFSVSENWKMSD